VSTAPLVIEAIVDDDERPALEAAAAQLRECLAAAAGEPWQVAVRFARSFDELASADPPTMVVASFLPEVVHGEETIASVEARWRSGLSALAERGDPPVLLCTVFRHVGADVASGDVAAVRERIRRMALLAIDLSHDTGAGVVDIDRVFAHVGARMLDTDFRLRGRAAAEAAGHAIVSGVLGLDLDDVIPPEIQERAVESQGTVDQLAQFVERRLAAHG